MNTLVVLFALAAVACGSIVPLAQPPHHPALVLDPHGRPLDTAEVINARALHLQAKALEHYPIAHASIVAPVAHAAVLAPAAVSHQSRVDVHHNSAIVAAPVIAAAPLVAAHASHGAYASPYLGYSALGLGLGHGHYLKKRSLGHYAYSAPIIAPAAVSHQSRVDVVSSPAIVSHAVAAPVLSHAVVSPVLAHAIAPAAVSHQSRVDVRSSPSIVAHSAPVFAVSPLVNAHSAYVAPYLAHSGLNLAGHGHYLKKRSLGHYAYSAPIIAPSAVSHQSRVDVVSSPAIVSHAVAAPILSHSVAAPVYAHAIAPAAVSHQSRVDVRSSPAVYAHVAPVAHSVIAAPLAYSGLLHAPLAHGAGHLVHGW